MRNEATADEEFLALLRGLNRHRERSMKPASSFCRTCETWGYDHRGFCDEEGSRSRADA